MSDESEKPPAGDSEPPRRIPRKRGPYRAAAHDADAFESCCADFDFWSKMALWTIDEAIALAFERDPETVTWEWLQVQTGSEFFETFRRMRKLADRARQVEALTDPCYLIDFIGWAQRNQIPFPAPAGRYFEFQADTGQPALGKA